MKLSSRRLRSQRWMQGWRIVALVVVLGLIVVLYRTTPDKGDFLEPVTVSVGEDGIARTPAFEITVDGVRTADAIVIPSLFSGDPGTTMRSSLGWVVVTVTAAGIDEPAHVGGMRISTGSGKSYAASRRGDISSNDLTSEQLSPELPVRAMVAVEMPAGDVEAATLEVSEHYFQGLEAVASLPLRHARHEATMTLVKPVHLEPGAIR